MEDPVCTADGHTYERCGIEQWLQSHSTSPMTNVSLTDLRLTPNLALRTAIEEWRERQPMAIDELRLTIGTAVLGQGALGRVMEGTLVTHGRPQQVAVKMLPGLTQAEQRKKFEKELKAHITPLQGADRICRLLGTCEKDHMLCVVMKRYSRSLAQKIAANKMSGSEIRRIAYSLSCTLAQLHGAGVLVQDIKPQNILLNQYDEPVYADFGISGMVTRTAQLMPTQISGTANYMSPEAFEPPLGIEADIWSLGCVIVK